MRAAVALTSAQTPVDRFLERWRQRLGDKNVRCSGASVRQRYGWSTTGASVGARGAITVDSVERVAAVVLDAAREGIALYPISTGKNWGYGGAAPPTAEALLLDLSELKAIDDSNLDLGLITVEPGVTQQQLHDHLQRIGARFLVPVHGGGPNTSLVGNALERGYGITPNCDHFAAVTALEAILPNGDHYRGALTEQGAALADKTLKWGVGPYLDGLFAQGAFGVVVRMTIALVPIPERVDAFLFRVRGQADLDQVVLQLRSLIGELGPVAGNINLLNARRMLSMSERYPREGLGPDGVISDRCLTELAQRAAIAPWTGFGALYGSRHMVRAARKAIRRRLRRVTSGLFFLRPTTVDLAHRVASLVPGSLARSIVRRLGTLQKSFAVLRGRPSEVALPLAYWKSGSAPPVGLDPARDGCGIVWYSPIVPMRPAQVQDYVNLVDRVCRRHGIEPLLTLTSLSERCFDSTLPILFDPAVPGEQERALACYDALLTEGRQQGFLPYRFAVHSMQRLVNLSHPCWSLVERLKTSVDPQRVIAPGRYCADVAPRSKRRVRDPYLE